MASSEDAVASAVDLEPEAAYQAFMDERHARIMDQVAEACSRSGRELCEVTAFAVSKTVGPREVIAAMRAGWDAFAENRPQELVRKLDAFAAAGVEAPRFDMIGNLQKNKINQVLGRSRASSLPARCPNAPSVPASSCRRYLSATSAARRARVASRLMRFVSRPRSSLVSRALPSRVS